MIACIDIVSSTESIKPFLLEVIGQQWLDLLMKTNDYTKPRIIQKKFRSGRTRYLGFIQKDVLPFEFKRVYYLLMPALL
jgi:uncharacterized protein involved in tolerance to divalent cations